MHISFSFLARTSISLVRFEIWSTGGYTKEALVLLKKTKDKVRKFDFDYLDQNDIKERANKLNSEKFKEILRDYYLKEIT